MTRLLALTSRDGREVQLLQDGPSFRLSTDDLLEADPLLVALLRERKLRLGSVHSPGEGVFDLRYGPFTGGLGETGLLHLSTYGERILAVEIDLQAKHRAIEASLVGRGCEAGLELVQTVCGSTAFAHQEAYAGAIEEVLGLEVGELDRRLSAIALELERIYNHLFVITRLAEAAAQRVLASHLGALFEEALRANRLFCGSRFLWGARRIGGMSARFVPGLDAVAGRVRVVGERFERLYQASLTSRNYLDRLHGIATVTPSARRWSLTGPALRAAGIGDDLRTANPLLRDFAPVVHQEGDSLARMELRADEVLQSCRIILLQIEAIEGSRAMGGQLLRRGDSRISPDAPDGVAEGGSGIGAAEGPSGLVAWTVTLEGGRIKSAAASTPSYFGYQVFAEAFAGHIFTDFPFALDSFGLSFADAAR